MIHPPKTLAELTNSERRQLAVNDATESERRLLRKFFGIRTDLARGDGPGIKRKSDGSGFWIYIHLRNRKWGGGVGVCFIDLTFIRKTIREDVRRKKLEIKRRIGAYI